MAQIGMARSRFPDGASVSLYPVGGSPVTRTEPPGSPIATAVVEPGLPALTFSDVPPGQYYAAADVGDRWIVVSVTTS